MDNSKPFLEMEEAFTTRLQSAETQLERRHYRKPEFLLTPEDKAWLQESFERRLPVEIEIGCGKGKFMTARAETFPHVRCVAIERVGKWLNLGKARAAKRGLSNLLFLMNDAREIIRREVPPASVQAFHIYFPDPWPKRRHQKRRLITADLLLLLYHRLISGGKLHLATDHEIYLGFIRQAIQESKLPWAIQENRSRPSQEGLQAKTNYELKYEAAGRTLYYLDLQRP